MSSQIIAPRPGSTIAPKQGRISKVIAVVHPFFRSGSTDAEMDTNPLVRNGTAAELMRRNWASEISAAAKAGTAFMIFIGAGWENRLNPFETQLLDYSRAAFGERVAFVGGSITYNEAQKKALVANLGAMLDEYPTGLVFGEWTSVCVKREAIALQIALGIEMNVDRFLSVDVERLGDKMSVLEQAANGRIAEQASFHPYARLFAGGNRYVPALDFMNADVLADGLKG